MIYCSDVVGIPHLILSRKWTAGSQCSLPHVAVLLNQASLFPEMVAASDTEHIYTTTSTFSHFQDRGRRNIDSPDWADGATRRLNIQANRHDIVYQGLLGHNGRLYRFEVEVLISDTATFSGNRLAGTMVLWVSWHCDSLGYLNSECIRQH